MRRLLNVVYAIMVDSFLGLASAEDVMEKVDEHLNEPMGADPLTPNREEWGTGPRAQRRANAMMQITGPPPGWPPSPATDEEGP